MYFWYVVCCINQITAELGIHCLTIKKQVKDIERAAANADPDDMTDEMMDQAYTT